MVGVDGTARPDEVIPPARRAVTGSHLACGVAVTGQGMAHQHGVGGVCVERPPRFVGHGDLTEGSTAFQREHPTGRDVHELPVADRVTGDPRPGSGQVVAGEGHLWMIVVVHGYRSSLRTGPGFPRCHARLPHPRGHRTLRCRPKPTTSPPRREAPWVSVPGCRTRETPGRS